MNDPPRLFPKREREPDECPKCGKVGTFYPWGDGAVECGEHGLFIGDFEQFIADLPSLPESPVEES